MNIQLIFRGFLMILVLIGLLLLLAGRWSYWQGWLLGGVSFILLCSIAIVARHQTDMLRERMKSGPGTKWWDRLFWAIYGPMNLAVVVVASLDAGRFLWSKTIPVYVYFLGYMIFIVSGLFHLWAIWSNRFYAGTVRIQSEKQQTVVSIGPYQYVRHPGYIAIMLMMSSMGVVLGSYWALIPAAGVCLLLILRTLLEDRTLRLELRGYNEYSQKVKYRLIPGIW